MTSYRQAICQFLINLRRHHRGLYDTLPPDLVERYHGGFVPAAFSAAGMAQARQVPWRARRDLAELVDRFEDCPAVGRMYSHEVMRVLLGVRSSAAKPEAGGAVIALADYR